MWRKWSALFKFPSRACPWGSNDLESYLIFFPSYWKCKISLIFFFSTLCVHSQALLSDKMSNNKGSRLIKCCFYALPPGDNSGSGLRPDFCQDLEKRLFGLGSYSSCVNSRASDRFENEVEHTVSDKELTLCGCLREFTLNNLILFKNLPLKDT